MTKYEWETELKKCMSRLPKAEIDRVLAYYNELFADRADDGMSEKQIINEFGNPADVAFKIMTDYGMDFRSPEDDRTIAPPDFYSRKKEEDSVSPPDFWQGRGAKKPEEKAKEEKRREREEVRDMKREDRAARKQEHEERRRDHEEKATHRGCFATFVFLVELVIFGGVFVGVTSVIWSLVASIYAFGFSSAVGAVYSGICAFMPGIGAGLRIVELAITLLLLGFAFVIIPSVVKIAKLGAKATVGCWKIFFGWYTNKRGKVKEAA